MRDSHYLRAGLVTVAGVAGLYLWPSFPLVALMLGWGYFFFAPFAYLAMLRTSEWAWTFVPVAFFAVKFTLEAGTVAMFAFNTFAGAGVLLSSLAFGLAACKLSLRGEREPA